MAGWFDSQGVEGYTATDPSTGVETGGVAGGSYYDPTTGQMVGGGASTSAGLPNGGVYGGSPYAMPPTSGGNTGFSTTSGGNNSPAWVNDPQYANINPQLKQAFVNAGVTPTGPGTGNTDIAYWNQQINANPSAAGYYVGRVSGDLTGSGMDTGGGSGGGSFSAVAAPSVTLPNIQAGVTLGPAANFTMPTQSAPVSYQNFSYGAFAPPTAAQVEANPGYQFGLTQGEQALQSNEALQGTLRSGGAAKALDQYATNYATQNYNNTYQQMLNTYQTNEGTAFQTNQANNAGNMNAWQANTNANLAYGNLSAEQAQMLNSYALGAGQLTLAGQTANQNYALAGANLNLGYYNAANQYNLGMANVGLGYGQLGLGYYNAGNTNALNWANYGLGAQAQDFNQGYALAGMGLSAATSTNNAGSNYANSTSNLLTGAGNSAAAGIVGSSNAWNAGLGAAGNAAMNGYGMYNYLSARQPTTTSPYGYTGTYGGVGGPGNSSAGVAPFYTPPTANFVYQ